jgi:ketosteroid isomerase-like protein
MRKFGVILSVVLIFFIMSGCQRDQGVTEGLETDVDVDKEAIYAWYDQKTETTNTGNFDGLKSLFSENVVFMPPDEPLYKGWEAYREWAQPFFEEFDIEENISYEEIEVSGDWAFIRTSYTMRSTPKAGGEPVLGNGKAIWLFKRQADGSWKGTHCIWNNN